MEESVFWAAIARRTQNDRDTHAEWMGRSLRGAVGVVHMVELWKATEIKWLARLKEQKVERG